MTGSMALKRCCAVLYQSQWAALLLGDSFHPGGLALTRRLGRLLNLRPGERVLDVAAGKGVSAIHLAQNFGCRVVGVDYGDENVIQARDSARESDVDGLVTFEQGDAEQLDFDDATFDAVVCECAFCTFPDKPAAAYEFARVLRPGGRVGLSDLTRNGTLPPELDSLLAWIACIADARPLERYIEQLQAAGFTHLQTEPHNLALTQMIRDVQAKLLGAELMVGLNQLDLPPDANLNQAKELARYTAAAVQHGKLGYALILGEKMQCGQIKGNVPG